MALIPQIEALKSSGSYRLTFDKSQTVSIPAEQIRLIVGFSKTGPFNTPVFVPDSGFFTDVFGDIDRAMERKGSYFHRTCLAALERGPILALNLWRLDTNVDTGDMVENISFSTAATTTNDVLATDLFSGFYNREKFWYPEDESFLGNISSSGNKLFNLVNLSKKPLTVIVRKAPTSSISGFDITAKEWFGLSDIPDYLHKDDYISDFMIDVILLEGDYGPSTTDSTPYERLASDPIFAAYFDTSKGIKRKISVADSNDSSLVEQFLKTEVKHLATYTGCLLPDFIDLNGTNVFIQDIINADTPKTGMFCAVNKEAYDAGTLVSGIDGGLDLIGHNLEFEQPNTIDFLSYKETIKSDLEYDQTYVTSNTITDTIGISPTTATSGNILMTIDIATNPDFYAAIVASTFRANTLSPRVLGSYFLSDAGTFVPVITKQVTATTALIEFSATGGVTDSAFDSALAGNSLKYVNYGDIDYNVDSSTGAASSTLMSSYSNSLYTAYTLGTLTDGDRIVWDADSSGDAQVGEVGYLDFNISTSTKIMNTAGYTESLISDTTYSIPVVNVTAYQTADFTGAIAYDYLEIFFDSSDVALALGTLNVQTLKGALNKTIPATSGTLANVVTVHTDYEADLAPGMFLVGDDGGTTGPSRLTRIVTISKTGTVLTVTTVGPVLVKDIASVDSIEVYDAITNWVDYYTLTSMNGFTHTSYHLPNNTMDQQNNILYDTLSGTQLFNALIDKDNITFRYIVDSFGLGIESSSKAILANLAKERQNAFAILNAPSMKNFSDSTTPLFLDANGLVSTKMISEGGDLTKNPTLLYTLPGITSGSNFAGYYAPYLVVRDRGRNVTVPPAGYISNNFIDKYVAALPWSIVAGARRGIIAGRGVVGIEYNFDRIDRDWLEPFGINPIIFQNGTGIVIFANKTGQQNIKSALSSIHVREVLIYLQDGIEAILKNFIFEFNTPQTRLEIKTLADNFMNQIQADNGVYDFRNIMDETNNTSEVIDKNIGILDTYVEPVKGLEILVHRTTILKTGVISTGEFI